VNQQEKIAWGWLLFIVALILFAESAEAVDNEDWYQNESFYEDSGTIPDSGILNSYKYNKIVEIKFYD